MTERASWDETWRDIARVMARRGDCVRAQVGAVIVSADNQALALTYNGPPPGSSLTCELHCPRFLEGDHGTSYTRCLTNHAEINGLLRTRDVDRRGGSMFVSGCVCLDCAKAVAASGLTRVCMDGTGTHTYRPLEEVVAYLERHGLEVVTWP